MSVTAREFFDWLAEHDVDYRNVKSVEFVPEGVRDDPVQMRVERYALNAEGKRFFHKDRKEVAMEVIFVPLKSLPGVAPQPEPVS
jgi:hypothetical protein